MSKAANVTKWDAGGSGDYIIADGYIKTVEKVWLDSYTMDFVATLATINIAVLPANKKVTGIDVLIYTAVSQTTGTVAIGFSTDASIDTFMTEMAVSHNLTLSTISLPFSCGVGLGAGTATGSLPAKKDGFQKVTGGTQTTITIRLDDWTASVGTIKTRVRYT